MQAVARLVLLLAASVLAAPAAGALTGLTPLSAPGLSVVESAPLDLTDALAGLPASATTEAVQEAVAAADAPLASRPAPPRALAERREAQLGEGLTERVPVVLPDLPAPVAVPVLPVVPDIVPLAVPDVAPRASPVTAPAVAAGAAAAAASSLFAPALGRFYSRLARGEALAHPQRRRVYEAIGAAPGASPSDLMRALGLANGALLHHLSVLEREGLVTRVDGGRAARLFLAGQHSPAEMRARATALSGSAERVLRVVRERPGLPAREAAAVVGVSVPTLHRTVERLEAAGLVERRREGRGHSIYPAVDAPLAA